MKPLFISLSLAAALSSGAVLAQSLPSVDVYKSATCDCCGKWIEHMREAGFKEILFKRKHPAVQDRVNTVNRPLRTAEGTDILRVDHSCRKFIESLEQTIYKEGTREVDKS